MSRFGWSLVGALLYLVMGAGAAVYEDKWDWVVGVALLFISAQGFVTFHFVYAERHRRAELARNEPTNDRWPMDVTCPSCGARPGRFCSAREASNHLCRYEASPGAHAARLDDVIPWPLSVRCPTCFAPPGRQCAGGGVAHDERIKRCSL